MSTTYESDEGRDSGTGAATVKVSDARTDLITKAARYVGENPGATILIVATGSLLLGLWLKAARPAQTSRRQAMEASVDFQSLITKVSLDFERRFGMPVDEGARIALILPALQHQSSVEEDLRAEKVTIDFIEDCIRGILERAQKFARSRGLTHIDREATQESMDEECPYLGWC